jgi:superfamily II DNA or RNA helicase
MSDFDSVIPFLPTEKTPRYYQERAAVEVAGHLKNGLRRILVKGPTGCGKTFTSKLISVSRAVREAADLPTGKIRVLFMSNKTRLNRQAVEEFNSVNEGVELIPQSAFSKIPAEVLEKGWDMVFLDECHHEAMMSIQHHLPNMMKTPIIGFTANDDRGDGLLLKFDIVVTAISKYDAAYKGFIERPRINSIMDTGATSQVGMACDTLARYHRHMGNTIIFAQTQAEAKAIHRFISHTLKIPSIVLGTNSTERDMDAALDSLSHGKTRFVINCQRVGEGIDTPNCTDVFLARTFKSAAEKEQYIGRACRPDSPFQVWEYTDAFKKQVLAKDVVALPVSERLIYRRNGEWGERILSGHDEYWGKMAEFVENDYNLRALTQAGKEANLPLFTNEHGVAISYNDAPKIEDANGNPTGLDSEAISEIGKPVAKSVGFQFDDAPQMALFG